jgi:hypothetical protein
MQKPGKHGAANALADDENVELHRGKDRGPPKSSEGRTFATHKASLIES